jgi:glycerol-3-phosphate dehydrogenase
VNRQRWIDQVFGTGAAEEPFDLLVIGGGATGVGTAVDAASRGFRVLLVEQDDFGKGTSSRSTKLVHGGVRYLQQGNVALVMEALRERGILHRNAPHLVHDLAFVVPNYAWWEAPFYGIGMKVYDALATRYGFGRSRHLSVDEVKARIPTLEDEGLRGGVLYYDGQFDDARLLVNLVQTAARQGAKLLNHCPAVGLTFDEAGFVNGARIRDAESGAEVAVRARVVVNATGPWVDGVRQMAEPGAPTMIAPSQGVHVVLDRKFLPGDAAIMVPRTSDGRVMFAIPWHDHALVGTTDTAIERAELEPRAREEEIDFLLETAAQYLEEDPTRDDVKAVFTGIRPLVRAGGDASTAELSRDHTIHVGATGLLTICGGKWTTYRKMAEDCVDHVIQLGGLADRPCITRSLNVHGYHENAERFGALAVYGADAPALRTLMREEPELAEPLLGGDGGAGQGVGAHGGVAQGAGRKGGAAQVVGAQVVWAVREEMARTVDDVLARRTRVLQLDARAARAMAAPVAALMARELGRDGAWETAQVEAFEAIVERHLP